MHGRLRSRAGLVLACLLLGSCGVFKFPKALFGGILPIAVEVAADANQNSPVAVEILLVHKKDLLPVVLELSARQWFEQREQFARDHEGEYTGWFWEWVPGQEVAPMDLPYKAGVEGGVIFADYLSAGQHRLRIDPQKPIRLVFEDSGFAAQPLR